MTTAWSRPKVGRARKKPAVIEGSADTGSVALATKHPAPTARGASQGGEPTREAEEEVTEPTMQEVLGDQFIVVPVRPVRALAQAWGTSPNIDRYAEQNEGVRWPTGAWTSRHRPEGGQTPAGCRRIVLRHASETVAAAAFYDTQEVGDRTWVLAMDSDSDPIGVWCLPHEAGQKFLKAFTAPRWTAPDVTDDEPDDEPAREPQHAPEVPVAAEPSWGEEFPPEPDFDW